MLALYPPFLAASIQAWRTVKGAARTRARSFAIAFGFRDLCWGVAYLVTVWGVWHGMFAEALQGGDISAKERALLNRLGDTLGIAPADAATLERDLQARR
jgi:hypothetical protein